LRIRCAITRAWLGGDDLVGARDIGIPLKIARKVEPSPQGDGQDALARRLQGHGPPQEIVDQRSGRRLQLGQSGVDIAALSASPGNGPPSVRLESLPAISSAFGRSELLLFNPAGEFVRLTGSLP
jgi:hypothetical protein